MIKKYGNKEYDYSKPEEEIIKITSVFKKKKLKKILDLGCGKGRHLKYLMKMKFDVYGIDINKKDISRIKKHLPKIKEEVFLENMNQMHFPNSFFDGVIANQTIYHTTKKGMKKTIIEIYRVLKDKGLCFVTLQPRENQEWRMGKKIEKNTYIVSSGPDKGIPHHFVDKSEIERLFGKENLIKVYRDSKGDWCVLGKSPNKKIK